HLEAGARARKQESSSRSEVVHDFQYRRAFVATPPATTRVRRDDHARQVSRRLALGKAVDAIGDHTDDYAGAVVPSLPHEVGSARVIALARDGAGAMLRRPCGSD